jgi:integrase
MQKVWHRKHDGWWYATVRKSDRQQQIKLHRGPDTPDGRARAEEQLILKLADLIDSEADRGPDRTPRWLTVGHVVTGFLAHSAKEHDSDTARWYSDLLVPFRARLGKLAVTALRKKHVLGFAKTRYENPTSQNKVVGAIKRAFAWAAEEEHIRKNPIAHVKNPNRLRPRDRVLEPVERALIASSIRDQAFRDYFQALVLTGCRPGEVAKVTAADVSLQHGVWILPEHKTAKKTGKPRVVYLTPEMVDLTRRLVRTNAGGPIFRNRYGKPWTRNAVRQRFMRLRKKFPVLKGVVAYSVRHTYATDALERGVPDADVAALMGHSGTAVLHAWYSKLSKRRQHLRDAASRATGGGRPGSPRENG